MKSVKTGSQYGTLGRRAVADWIRAIGDVLHIPFPIIDEVEGKLLDARYNYQGMNLHNVAVAWLFLLARENHFFLSEEQMIGADELVRSDSSLPKKIIETASYAFITKQTIRHGLKAIKWRYKAVEHKRMVPFAAVAMDSLNYVDTVCGELGLPDDVRRLAREYTEVALPNVSSSPRIIIAACVYIAGVKCDCRKRQEDIGYVVGSTMVSLRKTAYKVLRLLKQKKMLKDDFGFGGFQYAH
jgi:hypothetical protein